MYQEKNGTLTTSFVPIFATPAAMAFGGVPVDCNEIMLVNLPF